MKGDKMAKKKKPTKKIKYRKCFVLREVEIDMGKVVEGDIFRLGKATKTDCVNEEQWYVATTKAKACKPKGNYEVNSKPVAFIEQLTLNDVKFT